MTKKSDRRDRWGRFDNEKDKCTSLGICIILSESPNASKTTNNIVTVTSYLVRRRDLPPRPAFIFVRCCWAVMSRLIGIHTIQTTTTFLSGILNIARVQHCCKDVTFFFLVSHPPKLYILHRYTELQYCRYWEKEKRFTTTWRL